MRTFSHALGDGQVNINLYEGPQDSGAFRTFIGLTRRFLAIDTETTGLDIFSQDYGCRLVQFGDDLDAWVLPARYVDEIRWAIGASNFIVMHNAPNDILTLDQALGIKMEDYYERVTDTYIVSHILDSRSKEDDIHAIGHALKDLAEAYVAEGIKDSQKELKAIFQENKWTGSEGWRLIPEDNETYVRYAGLDTIITARLANKLLPKVREFTELFKFEHELMRLLLKMERRGFLMDVEYAEKLSKDLAATAERNNALITEMARAKGFCKLSVPGQKQALDLVIFALTGAMPKRRRSSLKAYMPMTASSNQSIVKGLQGMGETLTKTTDSGALAVDAEILNELCDVNRSDERLDLREPNPLAVLVKEAKRANKWNESYVSAMLETRDSNRRVHAKLSALKARTARMAVSRPPFQQLPSSDATIRDCLMADKGMVLIACDFSQIEPRVMAALSGCEAVIEQAKAGEDIYDAVTKIMFGNDFTKAQRKRTKIVYLGRGYQGGLKGLCAQTGEPEDVVKAAIDAIDEALPETRAYGQEMMKQMKRSGKYEIRTPMFGRRLFIDEERSYACVNHMVQSTARDIFAQSLVDLDRAGFGQYMLMPVHDEIVMQVPKDQAETIAKQVQEIMTREFQGVPLPTEATVVGKKWGEAYR